MIGQIFLFIFSILQLFFIFNCINSWFESYLFFFIIFFREFHEPLIQSEGNVDDQPNRFWVIVKGLFT